MLKHHDDAPFIVLDISRLISRATAAAATGIDRVELAYARYLLDHARHRTGFCAMHPLGILRLLPLQATENFVDLIEARWNGDTRVSAQGAARRLQRLLLWWPNRVGMLRQRAHGRRIAYLLTSHHHLMRKDTIARALRRWNAVFITMIHDLIPLEYPEYSRPREPERHRRRIETVAALADGVIVPSDVVGDALRITLKSKTTRAIPVWTIRHGVPAYARSPAPPESEMNEEDVYFVCLGTIEPRKNHLLLLNLWREMVQAEGRQVPRLILIGKRGWENENVIDMLERCPALRGKVQEMNGLPDRETVDILRGARALLFPSFSEGFGLPLAEALMLGVPAICADIPVLREVGGHIPEYLDPLDGPGWRCAIEDFCNRGERYVRQGKAVVTARFWGWTESVEASISQLDKVIPEVETYLA
ncbi:glycosyltransferase family 4 protein [Asaia krungthepensis]|nr:glycosyltransferase family 1 protein [Asaia krungthepensis]